MSVTTNLRATCGAGGQIAAIASGVGIGSLAFITGTPTSGSVLTANVVSGLTATSWQWTSNGTNISGATSSTYTVQVGDVGNSIAVVVNGILVSASVMIVSSIVTNAAALRVGMNISGANSYEYGHTYLDWTRRFSQNFWSGTTQVTPSTLKSNGTPTATYNYTLQAATLAGDALTYNCWMNGGFSSISINVGTISNISYNSGADQTTFTLVMTAGLTGPIITVTNPTTTADYIRIIPSGYDIVANANDFHPDLIARQVAFGSSSIRGMDWFNTNGNTDTNWAGSVAAGGDGSIRSASTCLSEFIRLANRLGTSIHFCSPRGATTDWFTNASALVLTNLPITKLCRAEVGNEPWNPALPNNPYFQSQLLPIAGTYVGASNMTPQILSVARISNVVTITLSGPPATTTSCILTGITNITGGFIDASKGIAVVGNVITYNETGADATGVITTAANNYFSYCHTNPTHFLVKALTTYGTPSTTGVSPLVMLYRYLVELTRNWWTVVQGQSDKARWRFILNVQPGANEFSIYPYAFERFGDTSWIEETECAPYIAAAVGGQTSAQILNTLATNTSTGLVGRAKTMILETNAARSFRHPLGLYECGTAVDGGTSADSANIAAATYSAGYGTTLLNSMTYFRDLGLTGPRHYFKDGCSFNYATHTESTNEQFWNVIDQDNTDLSKPKPQALIAFAAADSAPQPFTAALHSDVGLDLTWGTISFTNVCSVSTGNGTSGGSLVLNNTGALPDIVVAVVPPAGQTSATLSIYIASASGAPTDWCTVLLNDITLATQAVLTTGYPTPGTPFFSQTVTVIPNHFNEVRLQFKPATRVQFMALYQVVIS